MAATTDTSPSFFTLTTLLSLSSTLLILALAYLALRLSLPTSGPTRAPPKTQLLFLWHAFDCLIHFTLEASFLYNCFFSYTSLTPSPPLSSVIPTSSFWMEVKGSIADLMRDSNVAAAKSMGLVGPADRSMTPQGVYFMGQSERLYGAFYGTSPTARLWQEYARADARWGGSDLGIISLELLTVFVMAPLSVGICYYLARAHGASVSGAERSGAQAKAWILMIVVATGELYGGFMTFAPEWLSGNSNLMTGNWMLLWLYLLFFNVLWVFIPGWVLWEAWGAVGGAFVGEKSVRTEKAVTRSKKAR
ncbi:MAG: hypothetical protein M1828_000997 [Chrysothrix sp. TS-e1954]|nr:MAG: hypothetical protein M1828_000997 [Chrysothrix sp. TS-e1954]